MTQLTQTSVQSFSLLSQLLERRLLRPFYLHTDYPLSPLQINVLLLLADGASPSMSDIASTLDISKPNVTPIVDRLIAQEYAQRCTNTQDRRVINIRATEKGNTLIQRIQSDMIAFFSSRLCTDGSTSIKQFLHAIDTCIHFLETLEP